MGDLGILSRCVSDRKLYYGKMAEWIQMPFGMVSDAVGRGTGLLNGGRRGRGSFGVNLGRPITSVDFVA